MRVPNKGLYRRTCHDLTFILVIQSQTYADEVPIHLDSAKYTSDSMMSNEPIAIYFMLKVGLISIEISLEIC